MANKLTANGVSTTAHGERNTTNMITATPMESYIPVWQTLSASADDAVTSGLTRRNNISQVVI